MVGKMELEKLDRKTRKLMAMYGALHPEADVDRLYLQKCDGGRGLIGLEWKVVCKQKYIALRSTSILRKRRY